MEHDEAVQNPTTPASGRTGIREEREAARQRHGVTGECFMCV
jgi:hypothetical protein